MLGDTDTALGGGAESMSRGGYLMPALRWGQRMNDSSAIDMMVGAVTDPFDTVHMGITAEAIAEKWKITREQQDAFSVESHRRAISAIEKGYFSQLGVEVEIQHASERNWFSTDELANPDPLPDIKAGAYESYE